MKKHSTSLKRLALLVLAIVMLWISVSTTAMNVSAALATPVKGVQCNDYRGWAQDDPRWYNIIMNQKYCKEITLYHAGCAVISYTKLLIQSKVKTASFLPSDMTAWMENNGGYVKQTGKAYAVWENLANISPLVTYGGKVSLTSTTDDAYESKLIMDAINDGYYIIVGVKSDGHWVVVDNETSKKLGYPVIWNTAKGCSNPASYNVGQKLFSKYDTCSSIVKYKVSSSSSSTPSTTNKTYTIKYEPNGGTGTMADTTVTYGVTTNLRANTFTKDGFTFKGWYSYRESDGKCYYTNGNGSGMWCYEDQQPSGYSRYLYSDKAPVAQTTSTDKDIVHLYAVWEPKTSSSQIFYPIDLSATVLKSRINQQVSGDCAIVSMATIESYLYGATASADKTTVYNALVKKNTDNDYAYWSNCGYTTASIDWTAVYNQLAKGYPCIVHRPASGSNAQHWAVVAGYNGSSTTIEKDKFIVVDVYHGTGGTDIYTTGSWRKGTTIDRMAYRKNGISITSLSGIKFAIDHPAVLHKNGNGHGVYGYITSNENLTAINFKVTNVKTGVDVYNKSVTPNSKSYLIYNLDSEFTFAKWANGDYLFTVIAKTASQRKYYSTYFKIASSWPLIKPALTFKVNYVYDDGSGTVETQKINYNNPVEIISTIPQKDGYTFAGWNLKRLSGGEWVTQESGWQTEDSITTNGYTKKVYPTGNIYSLDYSWVDGNITNKAYSFYPVWEAVEEESQPNEPPLVEDNAPNDESVGSAAPEDDYVGSGTEDESDDNVFEESTYILGDVDNDGDVDADDYIRLKRFYFGQQKFDENDTTAELRSDVKTDGKIDADDYILLKRVYFGQAKLEN